MKLLEGFKNPELCATVLEQIRSEIGSEGLRFMEVCGTHTVAIFHSGLRSLLPPEVVHVSGPGCPVCVTHESEVAAFLDVASRPEVILATFGDLMRVPGPRGRSLKSAQAEGAGIRVVYSPMDALRLAKDNPERMVVFLGVGFETTAPTIAATVKMARAQGLDNFCVLCFHKLVPPALEALILDPEIKVQAFLLPGHVSAVIGVKPYEFLATQHGVPGVVSGFEPLDILQSILTMIRQRNQGKPEVVNGYTRVVGEEGNPKALEIMYEVFEPADALWRGIGSIPGSGLRLRHDWRKYDAMEVLGVELTEAPPLAGCRCGQVLKGILRPDQCPLFKKACTPASPVGPCMVSTEGSCAAYFKYAID
ncbi:MAG: hydrogenase formation protein HypD [Desulfohalobiaceae bacterium]